MTKKNAINEEKTIKNTNEKVDSKAIDKKTEFVNGLGASSEFTSVD